VALLPSSVPRPMSGSPDGRRDRDGYAARTAAKAAHDPKIETLHQQKHGFIKRETRRT
jgi:hypothetical protein